MDEATETIIILIFYIELYIDSINPVKNIKEFIKPDFIIIGCKNIN